MSNPKGARDALFGRSDGGSGSKSQEKPSKGTPVDLPPDASPETSEDPEILEQERREREIIERAKKSTDTLQNTLRMAREIRQIGDETMNDLEKQKAQLKGMHGKLDHIDNDVSRSSRLVKKMSRPWYDPRAWF